MSISLTVSRRIRSTPYTQRVLAAGVKSYTVYNHMVLPTVFESLEDDYWHLCQHVQVWDVSVERQVQITGPDAFRLIQLMTPRDLSKAQTGQCFYLPLCDTDGTLINDPIAIKHTDNHWWLSIASSDVGLWAKGLATGFGLEATVTEPNVYPLAIQGPKAEALMKRVFGDAVADIRFFRSARMPYAKTEFLVARSGWSKQGGFEVYVDNAELGVKLWDELFAAGEDLQVRAGCPNHIERIESGLLSFGNDMDFNDTPFECGLDKYISVDAALTDTTSLSIEALRAHRSTRTLVGLVFNHAATEMNIQQSDSLIGELRSQTWSPKYQKQLGFAMLDRQVLNNETSVTVQTDAGTESAIISPLPFDFTALGLS